MVAYGDYFFGLSRDDIHDRALRTASSRGTLQSRMFSRELDLFSASLSSDFSTDNAC